MTSADTLPDISENKIVRTTIFERNTVPSDKSSTNSSSYLPHNTKIFGHTIDYVEEVDTSNPNIARISLQHSADVTLGNKTFFNGPVMMKQLSIDNARRKSDASNCSVNAAESPWSHRVQRSFHKHRFLICSIITAFAVIVASAIVVSYILDVFGNGDTLDETSICEEILSSPSHYTCGYASACTRCKAMFPEKEICQSYYEADCGDLRCFCKPDCRSLDCRSTEAYSLYNNETFNF